MSSTHSAYIGLGSNLEQPEDKVRAGIAALGRLPQTRLAAASSLYRSAPLGLVEQPDFINAAAKIETELAPRPLLAALLDIEARFGRKRSVANAARTLDLDLLLYDDAIIDAPGLAVPHPRMHERAFVLAPLVEIAPQCAIPGKGPAAQFLAHCRDQVVARLAA